MCTSAGAGSGSTRFRRFRRRSGSFGAEPGQVQQGSEEGSEEGLEALVQSQVRFNKVPEKVLEKVWEALVQSQVRFNRLPEKVPEKVPGSFGAKPSQIQRIPGKVWCRARSGSTGSGEGCREGSGEVRFSSFCFHACTHGIHGCH